MSVRQQRAVQSALGELRHDPLGQRIRAEVDGTVVVDTTAAALVWQPRRVLAEYAVPVTDLAAELRDAEVPDDLPALPARGPVYPNVPFAVHTTPGRAVDLVVGARVLPLAGFVPEDRDLDGLVVLDFSAFDTWYQEDEVTLGHPRDPYHRVDSYPSSRRVRVEADGVVLADSTRPVAVFETMLPPRWYLPRADVSASLTPTPTSTICTYKGVASYWSTDGVDDVAWSYETPLRDAAILEGLVCFDDGKVTVTVEPN